MGDNLHQRAIVRQLMQRHEVWLETSWASLYHDLVDEGLHLIRKPVRLRTQSKNAVREIKKFSMSSPPPRTPTVRVLYHKSSILSTKSQTILEAMCTATGCDYATADFRLPLKQEWLDTVDLMLDRWSINRAGKPLMVYRPLVVRPEWRGSERRNANPAQYAELVASIRDQFFVISVADLQPTQEWIVGPEFKPDIAFHKGELSFELLAAMMRRADLIFTSSGFAAILGPAVETATVSILGGYESASWLAAGARFAPCLTIEPIKPCNCGTSSCNQPCTKLIDLISAKDKLANFLSQKQGCSGGQ